MCTVSDGGWFSAGMCVLSDKKDFHTVHDRWDRSDRSHSECMV